MAQVHVTEFRSAGDDNTGRELQIGRLTDATTQSITYTGTGAAAAIANPTRFVRIFSVQKVHVRVGATAAADNMPIAPNTAEYFAVTAGDVLNFFDGT